MNAANNTRLIVTKAILWLLFGSATMIAVARFTRGLGATTNLTDATPWGLWIGFDVLSGVALAAGGFVIAATVYIFHLDRYHGLTRAAILTAFLGYVAVVLGLLADLGRPWNIWRMIFYWQPDSPLFEVGWCVMLYLTVLALEFSPVVFEGLGMKKALRIMRHLTLILVIAGIGLSTLHQSSLGTLFLLAEDRMHPLWYSPIQPLLFFVSAVGLGLMMVSTESSVTSWLYKKENEWPQLRALTRAAAIVMSLFLVLRLGDLIVRGTIGRLGEPTWYTALFTVEVLMSVIIPVALFTLPKTRDQRWATVTGAICGVGGLVLYRADVGGISHLGVTGDVYVPALTEIMYSAGLVSAMALLFLFFVERFPVWAEKPALPGHFTPPVADRLTGSYFGGSWFGRSHLAGGAWLAGLVLGLIVLETTTAGGELPIPHPISPSRSVAAVPQEPGSTATSRLELARFDEPGKPASPTDVTTALLIDGDRHGRFVIFDHEGHRARLGGQDSCGRCHHRNLPLDRGTPCATCHRDMYRCSDTFNHELHTTRLGGNSGCVRCHPNPKAAKTRGGSTPCSKCHAAETVTNLAWTPTLCDASSAARDEACGACHAAPRLDDANRAVEHGMAPGYRWVMHRLCIECHCATESEQGRSEPVISRCSACHRGSLDIPETSSAMRVARLELP